MLPLKFISWNVNGIRAAAKNQLVDFMMNENADIYAFQEIKADSYLLPLELLQKGYRAYVNPASRKGYSGTLIITRLSPISTFTGFRSGNEENEGRIITMEFPEFWFLNIYFPNSQRGLTRLDYKLEFNRRAMRQMEELRQSKPLVICGDFNVAHEDMDIARPKDNRMNAGFTFEERSWMSDFLGSGYTDTFRMLNKDPGNYTWWTYRFKARERNIGWRIDYFVVSEEIRSRVIASEILTEVLGSDHAPVRLIIDF